jgi:hypothetical protein
VYPGRGWWSNGCSLCLSRWLPKPGIAVYVASGCEVDCRSENRRRFNNGIRQALADRSVVSDVEVALHGGEARQ